MVGVHGCTAWFINKLKDDDTTSHQTESIEADETQAQDVIDGEEPEEGEIVETLKTLSSTR